MSYGNTFEDISLNTHSTSIIVGVNGSGKSSISAAIEFALFGKVASRKMNKSDVINKKNEKNCLVELDFSIGSKEYKICRGLKPTVFEIYEDNKLLETQAASKDYQRYLERYILKFASKSYSQVISLSSTYSRFMELATPERRSLIENLLDIEVFSHMNNVMKTDMKLLNSKLSDSEYSIQLQNEKIIQHKDYILNSESLQQKRINDKKEQLKSIDIGSILNEIDTIQLNLNDLKDINTSDLNIKKDKLQILSEKFIYGQTKKTSISKEVKFLKDNDICPTCSQNIDSGFKANKINAYEIEHKKYLNGLAKIQEEKISISEHLKEYEKITIIKTDYLNKISNLQFKIKTLNEQKITIQEEIDSIKVSENVEIYKNELVRFEDKLKEIENSVLKLKQQIRLFDKIKMLLSDKGIKSAVIKKFIELINKYVNFYLVKFGFAGEFVINEYFEEEIKKDYRDTMKYSSLSEGEKSKVDVSLLLTWREIAKLRNSISTNLLIMDEIMDSSLDEESINSLIHVLNSYDKDQHIIIISHRDINKDHFNRCIYVKKLKYDFSQIIMPG